MMSGSDQSPWLSRREVVREAIAIGAVPLLAGSLSASKPTWNEVTDRFPEGVASGDPDASSVILWCRAAPEHAAETVDIWVELASDETFMNPVATRRVHVDGRSDWTCRILAGGLRPSTTYWYRFMDGRGRGSRIGRTRTSPTDRADHRARFAFVSCQNANMGPLTPWRRMIFDDRNAAEEDELEFVLHLGDFVYETVWLPEDRPQGYFDRKLRHIVDYPDGERHEDYRTPTSLRDYRALYRAYLSDPDLQDARARWPFVCIWDNGEYSNDGWQGLQRFGAQTISAQTRKVAANQAWFEFIPSRARTRDGALDRFNAPSVHDVPITEFDRDGLGIERNNLAAIHSLLGYRSVRWGRHVQLILTDQRTFRCADYTAAPEARAISSKTFFQMVPFKSLQAIDDGRHANGGRPPATLQFGDVEAPNWRRQAEPRTLLGARQRQWFLDQLASSAATWKIWGNTVATFDMRADPQNLPAGLTKPWPGKGFAGFARTDHSTAYFERSLIYDFVRDKGITGFVTLSGDRHSFWAGYSAARLPPDGFSPVGINFVVGSISSPGMVEAFEHILPQDHPLRALYLLERSDRPKPEPSVNVLLKHGVGSCLGYAASGELASVERLTNPDNAPHVSFVDMGGHGYGIARADGQQFEVEFVAVPRPVEFHQRLRRGRSSVQGNARGGAMVSRT